jgi:hypothetical protein
MERSLVFLVTPARAKCVTCLPRRKKIESMKLGPLALHVLPWLTAAALVPALACDPQVGTGYTGEVLFSLHGDVILADPDARGSGARPGVYQRQQRVRSDFR